MHGDVGMQGNHVMPPGTLSRDANITNNNAEPAARDKGIEAATPHRVEFVQKVLIVIKVTELLTATVILFVLDQIEVWRRRDHEVNRLGSHWLHHASISQMNLVTSFFWYGTIGPSQPLS